MQMPSTNKKPPNPASSRKSITHFPQNMAPIINIPCQAEKPSTKRVPRITQILLKRSALDLCRRFDRDAKIKQQGTNNHTNT